MILFPNCKINIGLNISAKRSDGYHDVETLMYPVRSLCDALEVVESRCEEVEFSCSGLLVDSPSDHNLCVKAYNAVKRRHNIGGVKMHLHKCVPMGAGLGGGSADAAYVIRALSDIFGLALCVDEMESLAAEVGSDAPFFISNRAAIATGRGEILTPLTISLAGYRLLIIKPNIGVSTAQAYAGISPIKSEISLAELLLQPVESWRGLVKNDFEASIFKTLPALEKIKESLYDSGAIYASMSGSGSALYGIYNATNRTILEPSNCAVYQEDLL